MAYTTVVVGILHNHKDQILLQERPADKPWPGYWEFPGGKIDAGEIPAAALIRELEEELNIIVAEQNLVPWRFVTHAYPEKTVLLLFYHITNWRGEPTGAEGQGLHWVAKNDLVAGKVSEQLLPADGPLLPLLVELQI